MEVQLRAAARRRRQRSSAATTRCTSSRSASTFRSARRCRSCSAFTPYEKDYSCRPGTHWTRFPLPSRQRRRTYTFACLICYEDSDPYLARQYVASEPVNFLVNISNDGWFDGTEEHEQHLAICRFRAVEARRAMVRAVNMGISAVIDPDGRVIALPGETWSESKKMEGVVGGVCRWTRGIALRPRWATGCAAAGVGWESCFGIVAARLSAIGVAREDSCMDFVSTVAAALARALRRFALRWVVLLGLALCRGGHRVLAFLERGLVFRPSPAAESWERAGRSGHAGRVRSPCATARRSTPGGCRRVTRPRGRCWSHMATAATSRIAGSSRPTCAAPSGPACCCSITPATARARGSRREASATRRRSRFPLADRRGQDSGESHRASGRIARRRDGGGTRHPSRASALVLVFTFTSLPAVAKVHYPWLPTHTLMRTGSTISPRSAAAAGRCSSPMARRTRLFPSHTVRRSSPPRTSRRSSCESMESGHDHANVGDRICSRRWRSSSGRARCP